MATVLLCLVKFFCCVFCSLCVCIFSVPEFFILDHFMNDVDLFQNLLEDNIKNFWVNVFNLWHYSLILTNKVDMFLIKILIDPKVVWYELKSELWGKTYSFKIAVTKKEEVPIRFGSSLLRIVLVYSSY